MQDELDLPEFEAFEEECLDADGLALVEYAIDMQNRGCILDLTGGRRLQTYIALSLGSIEPPEECPWDDINDIVADIDSVCCAGGLCDGTHPPTECTAGCAVAIHEFQVLVGQFLPKLNFYLHSPTNDVMHVVQGACGTTVANIFGNEGGRLAEFTAFEQSCVENADSHFFLEAIMNAGLLLLKKY